MAQCLFPLHIRNNYTGQPMTVPCGKCSNCIKNKRSSWAARLSEEHKDARSAYFFTLTYDESNVPITLDLDGKTVVKVLNFRDLQLFIKRFRISLYRKYGLRVRHFCCGEYGPRTKRPHYHGIFFFPDFIDKASVYELLKKSWTLGFITFSEVTDARIMYCSKYMTMANKETGILKRRPYKPGIRYSLGIGRSYISRMKDYHQKLLQSIPYELSGYYYVTKQGFKTALPRYFKDKIYTFSQKLYISWFQRRRRDAQISQARADEIEFSTRLSLLPDAGSADFFHLQRVRIDTAEYLDRFRYNELEFNKLIKTYVL